MDIVERLIVERDIGCATQSAREVMADAANEITRLRKVEAAAQTLSLQMRDDVLAADENLRRLNSISQG